MYTALHSSASATSSRGSDAAAGDAAGIDGMTAMFYSAASGTTSTGFQATVTCETFTPIPLVTPPPVRRTQPAAGSVMITSQAVCLYVSLSLYLSISLSLYLSVSLSLCLSVSLSLCLSIISAEGGGRVPGGDPSRNVRLSLLECARRGGRAVVGRLRLCVGSRQPPCVNNDPNCPGWAVTGQCTTNSGFMLSECKLACAVRAMPRRLSP